MSTTDNRKAKVAFLLSLFGKNQLLFAFTAIIFAIVALVLLSRAAGAGISHDEFQFVAGGEFFRTKGLLPYIDYPFLHMPYMPVFYGIPLVLGRNDLLNARLFNEFCIFISLILLFIFTSRLFKNKVVYQFFFGTLSILLFIYDPSFISMDGRALNHSIPILLSMGIIIVYWKTNQSKSRKKILFFCGLFAGIATGTRLSYAIIIIPILFAILFDPQFKGYKEKLESLMALCFGFVIALVPAGIIFLIAPKPFIYGNFHYIALNTIYRKNLGYTISMSLLDKLSFFYKQVLSNPTNLLIYFGWVGFLLTAFFQWIRTKNRESFLIIFVYLFGTVMLMAAFAPTPLWPQYFFGPVPFFIMGLFLGVSVFFKKRPVLSLFSLLSILAIVLLYLPFSETAIQLKRLMIQDQWTAVNIQRLGKEIGAHIPCTRNCKILTLIPILPLEARLDAYQMFTVGSFSWRTAPILSKERRAEYGIISPEELANYLISDPPSAILTGTEADYDGFTKDDPGGLDQPFVEYAIKNKYHPIKILDKTNGQNTYVTLWIK